MDINTPSYWKMGNGFGFDLKCLSLGRDLAAACQDQINLIFCLCSRLVMHDAAGQRNHGAANAWNLSR